MGYKYRDTKAISIDPVTETGNIVTFENPDDVTGITSLIADIEPKQDGTPWVSPDNTAPYLLRQSPQYGNEYNNEFDTLIGGSIAWNQLVQNGNFASTSGWSNYKTTKTVSSNILTITVTSTGDYPCVYRDAMGLQAGHKILVLAQAKGNVGNTISVGTEYNHTYAQVSATGNWQDIAYVYEQGTAQQLRVGVNGSSCSVGDVLQFKNVMLIDITATFGTEIADYVYSLEQSTAGSGIAWLKSYGFLTKDYYAYNDGSLVSVKTSEHRTTGKNQLRNSASTLTTNGITFTVYDDGSVNVNGTATANAFLEMANLYLLQAGTYIVSGSTDSNAVIIVRETNAAGAQLAASPSGSGVSQFTRDGSNTIGVVLRVPSGATLNNVKIYPMIRFASVSDATYEPYTVNSYPLGNDDLRGIFKLSNGNLYADGDVKTSDGKIARKYGLLDLGSLTYEKEEQPYIRVGYAFLVSGASVSAIKRPTDSTVSANILCPKYVTAPNSAMLSSTVDKLISFSAGGALRITDLSYSTAEDFKTAMSGVYLLYELATPTTETADPFTSPQIVSPLGTEEYVDERSVPVPVGHRTVYKNIAPISGYSEINIYVSPTEDAEDATVYPIDLNGTRYGKQMNVTTGQLEVCPYYASYNGETLTGEWISDRDVYAPGTTPSIGAQVVNIGGTLTTEQLLPTDIKSLVGTNNVWSDSGDITLTYAVDPSLYITLPKEAVSMDGRYLERMIDGYTTLYVKGRESLGIELNTYSVGTADGERVKGSRYPSRTLTIGFQLLCEDEVEFRAKFNQLNNLLSIGRADFIFADEPTMFFTGTPVMDASIEPGRNNVTGEWKLYCDYPFKRSVEPTVLSSTDSGVLVGDHEATFVFDYKGVMPAKPILRCEFDSTKSGGDYSEDGDCGFVAFLNQDESIIQLGNPEIIDLDAINKSATLINSEFSSLTNWTVDGMTAGNIVDPYWNNGEGQMQSYAKGIGTLSRTTTGAIDFDFSIVHRLCVNASSQTGAFKVDLTNDGDTIVGFAIEKTGNGTSATVSYIVNGIVVGTDNIDISYNNANFGFCSRTEYFVVTDINGKETILTKDNYYCRKFGFYDDFFGFGGFRHGSQIRKVRREYDYSQSNLNSRISRNGNAVTFQIGNLAKRTFKNNDIENVPCYDVKFETTGNFDTNAIRSCSFIRKTGVAFAKIPNVFTAGDIVEADCNSANVFMYRNGSLVGHLEPQYGALGNNWEDFNIKVGHNIIRAVWSEWSNPAYKPVIKIIFNEVYI